MDEMMTMIWVEDDDSSISDDSVLILEYGGEHLHDEYGDVTNWLNDTKVEFYAKEYFARGEVESANKRGIWQPVVDVTITLEPADPIKKREEVRTTPKLCRDGKSRCSWRKLL